MYNDYLVGAKTVREADRDACVHAYTSHERDVTLFFKDKPGRLLTTNGPFGGTSAGDVAWFIGHDAPLQWPHVNESSQLPLSPLLDPDDQKGQS
jgi:hypothetical protein